MQDASQGYRLLGLVLLSLLLMFADNRFDYLSKLRYYTSFVITPVHWLVDVPNSVSESVDRAFQTRSALLTENTALKEELLMRQYQLQKLAHLSAENKRLSELLNASSIVEERVVRAQLTGESPNPFSKKVLINKGSNDGVYVGQPVLDAFGLMGQVVEVEPFNSWVLLITDPQHSTPVQINRNGIRAVASGTQDSLHQMMLNNIPDTTDIVVGDVLVTSGLGQRFPAGYPVGVVGSIVHDPGQPFAIVTVVPAAELDKSRNLLLVFDEMSN
ncbi:rod shape-determining protein MreC [Gammaproteobacteria bacterium]|nr:rod shape-determining protein MreC [Gammaproteobacteria bacterium]